MSKTDSTRYDQGTIHNIAPYPAHEGAPAPRARADLVVATYYTHVADYVLSTCPRKRSLPHGFTDGAFVPLTAPPSDAEAPARNSALQLLADACQRIAERHGRSHKASGGIMSRWFGLLQCGLLRSQHDALVAMAGAAFDPMGTAVIPFL